VAAAKQRDDLEPVAMKSKETNVDVAAFLRNVRSQMEYAESELRRCTASIKRTGEALRSSRETIRRTKKLASQMKGAIGELRREG